MNQRSFLRLFLTFSLLITLSSASTPALFCKCAWKYNSSIVSLNEGTKNSDGSETEKTVHTCNDCNRQHCLDYNFLWFKEAGFKEEELFTTCFQRDSAKDQAVVYLFILMTVGLLVYAAVRPWVEKNVDRAKGLRSTYTSVPSSQNLQ